MAYVVPADFRTATVQAWTTGLTLSTTEASDPTLTSVITAVSEFVNRYCDDYFEPETGVTLTLNGRGTRQLFLPKRIRAITTVQTRAFGTSSYTATTNFVTHASALSAATEADVDIAGSDFLMATSALGVWPSGTGTVQVIGNFSWPAVPINIKRAVSLLVWDWIKPLKDELRRARAWNTDDMQVQLADANPTRVPAANDILNQYRRRQLVVV